MNALTTVSLVAGAVIVIGGVAYAILRQNSSQHLPKKKIFQVSDILEWVDQVTPRVYPKETAEYFVKVLPTEDTQQILTKRTKNAYAILFVEKSANKISVLEQTVIIAESLSPELCTLRQRKIVEMPIKF